MKGTAIGISVDESGHTENDTTLLVYDIKNLHYKKNAIMMKGSLGEEAETAVEFTKSEVRGPPFVGNWFLRYRFGSQT